MTMTLSHMVMSLKLTVAFDMTPAQLPVDPSATKFHLSVVNNSKLNFKANLCDTSFDIGPASSRPFTASYILLT